MISLQLTSLHFGVKSKLQRVGTTRDVLGRTPVLTALAVKRKTQDLRWLVQRPVFEELLIWERL